MAELDRRTFLAGMVGSLAMAAWPHDPEWRPAPGFLRSLPRLLELASVPGVAAAVVEQGTVVVYRAGRTGPGEARGVTSDTVFEAASLGKPLVAFAALRLAERGRLDLDRPLTAYVKSPEAGAPAMRRITARHVLSHTTGLPNWRSAAGPLQPAADPGSGFSYSGEGFFYLQRVIEHVTHTPFARWMEEDVLVPLGMTESSFVWRPGFESRMAVGCDAEGEVREMYGAIGPACARIAAQWRKPMLDWRVDDALKAVPLVNPAWPALPLYAMPNAACSLLTTARDYGRFLTRLVARGRGRGLDLRTTTLAAMLRPAVRLNSALSWGLGWGLQRDEHGELLWHWGANMSFRNFVLADRANGRAVAVFTNGENGPRIYERVITAVTGRDHPSFLWI